MKKIIIGLLVAMIIMMVGCSSTETPSGDIVDTSAKVSDVVSESEPSVQTYVEGVDYAEIYQAYKENELRADDTYKNNRYRITAEINGMSTGGLFNLTGGATLTMETRIGNTIVFFLAEFEKEQEELLKTVNVGDTITFEGECLSDESWVKCEIIK